MRGRFVIDRKNVGLKDREIEYMEHGMLGVLRINPNARENNFIWLTLAMIGSWLPWLYC